ncbi:MAG: flagellar basal body rod protein FlgF [Gammaproteobacteria bacterium]|jgi:flagellar basal-body rod protein FlgF|nr:flagellar basal body rod protein FlgF [Gammaproteobacteria bacterium]
MDKLIHVALSSLRQAEISQRVVAANLANAETVGYRADNARGFSSVYLNQGQDSLEPRVFATTGEQTINTESGGLSMTGRDLDVAVNGDGYLLVEASDGKSVLSRRGDLRVSAAGVLENGSGQPLVGDAGRIQIPPNRAISIGSDGTVRITPIDAPEDQPPVVVGRLGLVGTPAAGVKRRADGNIEAADGNTPAFDPAIGVVAGALEKSNVNSVEVLTGMVELSRMYEAQTKLLKIATTLDESSASLMRIPE